MEHMNRNKLIGAAISVALLGASVVLAEDVVVQSQRVVVRAGKGSMFPPVGEAAKDSRLTVVGREEGGWLVVKIGDKQGYVKESALAPRQAGSLSGISTAANAVSGNDSSIGVTAAARGIGDDAKQYAATKNYNTAPLQQMTATRDRVAGERWIAFTAEGKVGPSKP
jgi:uncharacterized protein YraI